MTCQIKLPSHYPLSFLKQFFPLFLRNFPWTIPWHLSYYSQYEGFCSTTWHSRVYSHIPHLSYSSIFFISFFIKNGLSIRRKISNGLTWLNMNLTHSTQFLQSHNTDDFLFFYGLSQHTGKCLFLDAYRVLKYQFPAIKY